jgi:rubrerythrin
MIGTKLILKRREQFPKLKLKRIDGANWYICRACGYAFDLWEGRKALYKRLKVEYPGTNCLECGKPMEHLPTCGYFRRNKK